MHQSAAHLDSQLPIPVINPGVIAYKMLETFVELGMTHSKKAFPAPEVPKDAEIAG
jgi:allantoin racemase